MKHPRTTRLVFVSVALCFGFGLAQGDAEALKVAKSVVGQFNDVVSQQDAVAMGQLFTCDAKLFAEGGHLEGREDIQEFQRESFEGGLSESSSSVSEAWLLGDVAFVVGDYPAGNFLQVLKKTDGKWRIHRLIYTSEAVPEDTTGGSEGN